MSNTGWFYLLAVFAWIWIVWRFERLGNQLEAVSRLVRIEMAELVGNADHAHELREEWKEERKEKKKEIRRVLIVWGIIGALALAWWWFTSH